MKVSDSVNSNLGVCTSTEASTDLRADVSREAVTMVSLMECGRLVMGQSTSIALFQTIPPERVGLSGEYDYNGLAKRVSYLFSQTFEPDEIAKLRVTQRGAVVLLLGKISSQQLLVRLVQTAMSINGAVDVEVNGVSLADRLRSYLDKPSRASLLGLLDSVNNN
jgi:osmotically-inducible protein OsmY